MWRSRSLRGGACFRRGPPSSPMGGSGRTRPATNPAFVDPKMAPNSATRCHGSHEVQRSMRTRRDARPGAARRSRWMSWGLESRGSGRRPGLPLRFGKRRRDRADWRRMAPRARSTLEEASEVESPARPNSTQQRQSGEFATPPLGQQDHGAAFWLTERRARGRTASRVGTPAIYATSGDGPDRASL